MENLHLQNIQIEKILDYDFDYFNEISNLETNSIDILHIDLSEEQYLAIHNDVHCHIIMQNMEIVDKTREKIKRDFEKISEQIMSIPDHDNIIDLNNPNIDKWYNMFSNFNETHFFLNRLFMLTSPGSPDKWYQHALKNQSQGFLGQILLYKFFPYSDKIDRDDIFSTFMLNANVDNIISLTIKTVSKNKETVNNFLCQIIDSLLSYDLNNNYISDIIYQKLLSIVELIKSQQMNLNENNAKKFCNFSSNFLNSSFSSSTLKNEENINKILNLIFTYQSLFSNNIVKEIAQAVYKKEKIPFIESEILKRSVDKEENLQLKKKKRL